MKLYLTKSDCAMTNAVALDDMFLTKTMPTTAGSKMLDNYMSLFDAEVVTKLTDAGYEIAGKANVGEMAVDLMGETSYQGAVTDDNGTLLSASAEIAKEAKAVLCFDVNGAPRRAAAINDLVFVKPTYGTVSRFGTISSACSGETVGVMAKTVADAKAVLTAIAGHDDKDGTSLSDAECEKILTTEKAVKKVAVAKSIVASADDAVKADIEAAKKILSDNGVEVAEIDDEILTKAKAAWNILMSAELCNNVSRFDGVKYGYRSENYTTIEELYTNSRTEAFGELLKTMIIYGSDVLSTDNYMSFYDKAMRIRRVIAEKFAEIFAEYDAVMLPASSKKTFTKADTDANKYLSFDENLYTAPATITGLPAVVGGGVQLIGKAFSDSALMDAVKTIKEGK